MSTLLHVIFLAPRILTWLLHFWKFVDPLLIVWYKFTDVPPNLSKFLPACVASHRKDILHGYHRENQKSHNLINRSNSDYINIILDTVHYMDWTGLD
jgi:hypothetical protein